MATLFGLLEIIDSGMSSNPVIPQNDGPRSPLDASLVVGALRDMVVQKLQDIIGLLALETDDATSEPLIHVQRLFAGDGVATNKRVHIFNGLPPHLCPLSSAARILRLLNARMNGLKRAKEVYELRREAFKVGNLRRKNRIAPAFGLCDEEEGGRSRGLLFVGDIRVPSNAANSVLRDDVEGVVGVTVNKMKLGNTFRMARCRVNMKSSEVASPLLVKVGSAADKIFLVPI